MSLCKLSTLEMTTDNHGMKTLGKLIQAARKRAGYRTQGMLAAEFNRDASFISDVERDALKYTLQPADMHRLRDLLGVRVVDLLTASGYELEDMTMSTEDPDIAEITEHAGLVDWHADPSRLQVIQAILETWSRFDRNSLRQAAESSPEYE